MKAYERLLKYVKFPTQSSEVSGSHPSTPEQFALAKALSEELSELGCKDVRISDCCYVYATLEATPGYENATRIGFIAHMDTAPDFSGKGVDPQIIENYNAEPLSLGESGRVLDPATFPHLLELKGRTLITTNGETLLGADDKAGISEIMTALEIIKERKLPHGKILVAFTPDEEIGEGADGFDVAAFGADFAYTVDGGEEGSLEYENFNAASASFEIKGVNVHPGSAKDIMINASSVAIEIDRMLPTLDRPEHTEGYEGFFHLIHMEGSVECAKLAYIVRDHSKELFEAKKQTLVRIKDYINKKYGEGTVSLEIKDSYYNMKEKVLPEMHLVENAMEAVRMAGLIPKVYPIRGGTDGARLSFMGLVCPNLGTGGYAFHGPFEHITAEGMDKATEIILNIISIYKDRHSHS
ncbi:MAG: peptidase T [Clostridia bacterium]|nr:peptidase T [Clostridia bacterium]